MLLIIPAGITTGSLLCSTASRAVVAEGLRALVLEDPFLNESLERGSPPVSSVWLGQHPKAEQMRGLGEPAA